MSHSRGNYKDCRFCPKCGVETLERDRYMEAKNCPHAEYLCRLCGFGFRIGQSARVTLALKLFREHRQIRHNQFADDVTDENKEKYCELYPH